MTKLLKVSFFPVLAGIICSFIDVIFWDVSLDFVGLFDWFIFDAKDVFLIIGLAECLTWLFINEQKGKNTIYKQVNDSIWWKLNR